MKVYSIGCYKNKKFLSYQGQKKKILIHGELRMSSPWSSGPKCKGVSKQNSWIRTTYFENFWISCCFFAEKIILILIRIGTSSWLYFCMRSLLPLEICETQQLTIITTISSVQCPRPPNSRRHKATFSRRKYSLFVQGSMRKTKFLRHDRLLRLKWYYFFVLFD